MDCFYDYYEDLVSEYKKNYRFQIRINHLLRNTKYKNLNNDTLSPEAFILAYKYANINLTIFEERPVLDLLFVKDIAFRNSEDSYLLAVFKKILKEPPSF